MRAFSRIWMSPPAARFTMPCRRLRNELDELLDVEGRFCRERTEPPRDELELVRPEVLELLVRPKVLELPEELCRGELEPVIRSCIVA